MTGLRYSTLAAVILLVAMLVALGRPSSPDWWPGALAFALWAGAPLVVPLLCQSRGWLAPGAALVLLALVFTIGALVYCHAFLFSRSSTAALALLSAPLLQWTFIALFLAARRVTRHFHPTRDTTIP